MTPAKLAGRCCDGRELGQGSRIHALNRALPANQFEQVCGKALCGAKPGRRSAGWSYWPGMVVSCPRCLKALAKVTP